MVESTNTTATAGRRGGDQQSRDLPQLSCDLCRERKVKCDKLDPCTNCTTAGVPCSTIYRNRLPRGRYTNRSRNSTSQSTATTQSKKNSGDTAAEATNKELRERIHHLENLVQSGNSGTETARNGPQRQVSQSKRADGSSANEPEMSLGSSKPKPVRTPESMTAEMAEDSNGSKGQTSSEDVFDSSDPPQFLNTDGALSALGLWGSNGASQSTSQEHLTLNKAIATQLCRVYLEQVDPIIKILHRPSIYQWMVQGEGYLRYPDGHPSIQALEAAICYVAASSLTENQCMNLLQVSKSKILDESRKACEVTMQGACLLSTQDITVLQAFVLYLVGRSCQDRNTAIWTLVSVAVRTGENLGLHSDLDVGEGRWEMFFEQQMRKRLWLTICSLDLQTALAQGSQPLIGHDRVRSALSQIRHINDSDFGPAMTPPVLDREEHTEMTFAYVTYQLQLAARLLNFHDDGPSPVRHDSMTGFPGIAEPRKKHAREFEEKALGVLRFCDPESSPFAWFAWHSTQCLVASIRVSTFSPILHGRSASQVTLCRSKGNPELLRMALRVLEKAQLMHADQRGEGFRWYVAVPWQTLATAIAECCVSDDLALVWRAWPVIETAYQQHEMVLVQRRDDIMQHSMSKLMQHARGKLAGLPGANTGYRHSQNFGATGASTSMLLSPLDTPIATSMENPSDASRIASVSDAMFDTSFDDASRLFQQPQYDLSSYFPDVTQGDMTPGMGMNSTVCPTDTLQSCGRMLDGTGSMRPFIDCNTPGMFF